MHVCRRVVGKEGGLGEEIRVKESEAADKIWIRAGAALRD